ncbi:hypothetical protein GOY18_06355 [Aeromonas hydrophila]|uniref:hypothetical protein n=1 Tax=Aeromonas hydrophila TaxID=644 RepID=UPI001C5A5E42|nr:hypothetical protein [Aeromonas hydrophila]MBW3810936.1 hypothetical protein [Aeromonas hydrophila]
MAKHITIKVPGKHPQTGELTTFEFKGQRMDIDIGTSLTARYAIPENKPSRTTCARMAIDRLVAQYGSQHLLDRLNCKPVINQQ